MQLVSSLVIFAFLSFFPAQAREASRMSVQTYEDACMGLSEAECCAQFLELAGFRATGDQLPKTAKNPVRMSCGGDSRVVPEAACRSIVMGRGFSPKELPVLCAVSSLEKRCKQSADCKKCTDELDKLGFKAAHRACFAVTYVTPKESETKVITLREGTPDAARGGVEIRKRRTIVQ